MDLTNSKIITIVITTFIFTASIMPLIIKIAKHIGAIDKPNSRKVHTKEIPRLGGLAIFLGMLLGYMLFAKQTTEMISVLIGSFIIVLTGVVDDINPIKAKSKLIGQIAAALVITFYGNITLSNIDAFGIQINFGVFSSIVTIIFILGITNCINLIDGLDGLSGGISAIYFLTIGIISIFKGQLFGLNVILSFIMLGSTLGFLVYNFNPAKIFAGDTGSMLLGFIISIISLLGFKNITMTSIVIPMLLLAIPILDTLFAIIRRKLKRQSISKPDKCHIHHQLLDKKMGHKNTVLIIYGIDGLFALASIFYVLGDRILGMIVYGILTLIVLWFMLFTSVISEENLTKKLTRKK